MRRKLALLIVVAAAASQLASCGAGKRCTDQTPGSFSTFLEDEWRAYCVEYHQHIENPTEVTLLQLTKFFSEHPARVKALNKSLYGYEKFESCFESPKAELELRELQTCLQDNDQSDVEITNAWSAVAEPWAEDLQLRVAEISPRLSDAEREAKRQLKKVSEAFDFQTRLEGRDWESLQVELKSLDKAMAGIEGVDTEFGKVLAQGKNHEALSETMQAGVAPQINAIAADLASLRGRHADLLKTAHYLEYASLAAGVKCPDSAKGANSEMATAKKIVTGRNNEVGGSGPKILTKTRPDSSGDIDFERFEGFVCGTRGPENQFEGSPQLCGQYRYVVERQKPAGASKKEWGDWTLKSFEESGSNGGVDCTLKKK